MNVVVVVVDVAIVVVDVVVFTLRAGAVQTGGELGDSPALPQGQSGEELHGETKEEAKPSHPEPAPGRGPEPRHHAHGRGGDPEDQTGGRLHPDQAPESRTSASDRRLRPVQRLQTAAHRQLRVRHTHTHLNLLFIFLFFYLIFVYH